MDKGIIYYTDNSLDGAIMKPCLESVIDSGLPVTSCSLKPIDLGKNIVLNAVRCYVTYIRQIICALEHSENEVVFFCEHDVLYHSSHFLFTPLDDKIYYYNRNNWRWDYPKDRFIRYKRLISLSMLCVNRLTALAHFKLRYDIIKRKGFDKVGGRDPSWARKLGYEPGTKPKRKGGVSNESFAFFDSNFPNIDIRHSGTFSPRKVTLDSFKHLPDDWTECSLNMIPGWRWRDDFITASN